MNELTIKKNNELEIPLFLKKFNHEDRFVINQRTKKTSIAYKQVLKQFIEVLGFQNSQELYDCTIDNALVFLKFLENEDRASSTINKNLSALSKFYDELIKLRVIDINPISSVRRPQSTSKKATLLTKKQIISLLNAPFEMAEQQRIEKGKTTLSKFQNFLKHRDRAIMYAYFYSGGRANEPSSLNLEDYTNDGGYKIFRSVIKGGANHDVALSTECQAMIDSYLEVAEHTSKKDPLFYSKKKTKDGKLRRLDRITIHQIFRKYGEFVRIENAHPHQARSSFISYALDSGAMIEDVQKTVGHKRITTTQGYDLRKFNHSKSASLVVKY